MKGTYRVRAGLLGFLDTERGDWPERAACAEIGVELFFPEDGMNAPEAKQICAGCPVRRECLNDALEHNDLFGIFGGLAPRERRKLREQVRELPRLEPRPAGTTPSREGEVLLLIASGLSTARVAERVGVSLRAVERAIAQSTTDTAADAA